MLRKFRNNSSILSGFFVCSFGFVLQKLYSNYSFTMKLLIFMENDLLKSYMYADREKMTY